MKFVNKSEAFAGENKIYLKLLAYKNQTVEHYGIPAMWYQGVIYRSYYGIGMTLCSTSLAKKRQNGKLSPINLMVVFYQTVRI